MLDVFKLLISKAHEIAREVGAKVIVLIYPPNSELELNFPGDIVVVGRDVNVKSENVKMLPFSVSIGLQNLLSLVSAFLKSSGIAESGEPFVYVTRDSLGVKVVEDKVLLMSGEFFESYGEVINRVLEIAIELSIEGREGVPVGTIFVIGDTKEVMKHSHQLVPNPFKGHHLNIFEPKVKNIIKEFSFLDGAFIISSRGRVVAAGRYLDVDPKRLDVTLPQGLGSRHLASAAITKVTKAIAVTLSESGTIRIFKNGQMVFEYNPRLSFRSL
ncbi:hypothetical protein PNA2_1540 [Pyrococcus sp. NA2]|uniref:DNA integrity scanning protein DisA nucleotide-binding domain protein n=1 Tax=Pyrococcus sp. (strain NA2) TaxID=342949 RepID=UPI000209B083|nr:diadenylate cyclase [Pyrococcus sp. NA2]AEC52454.1 hypothetical protein PNA2_1540 [Pyrococcus sp. NA2]